MAGLSNYAENKVLDHSLSVSSWTMPTGCYISLHSADPSDTGANEIGGVTRQGDTAFNAAASGATANTSAISFTSMPTCSVSHVGIWDSASSGNFLWGGAVTGGAQSVNSGDTFTISAGDLDVTID